MTKRTDLLPGEIEYKAIFDALDEGYYEVDLRGNITFFNNSLAELLGHPQEALLGMNNRDFADEENASQIYAAYNAVYRSGKPNKAFVMKTMRQDGTPQFLEASISLRRDEKGVPVGFRGMARDVTALIAERQKTEQAYQRRERWYRQLFITAVDAMDVLDMQGRIADCNTAYAALTGYSRKELLGRPISELIADEERRQFQAMFPTLLEAGVAEREVAIRRKDGTLVYLLRKSRLIYNETEQLTGIVSSNRDMTARKEELAQLRLQDKVLQTAANGIVITDIQGTILWVNQSFSRLTGYSIAEAIGSNLRLLRSGEHGDEFYKNLWERIIGGQVWQGEIVNKRKDGTLYTEEMTITPVTDSAGGVTHFVAVKQDITARKQAEQSLRSSQQRLETILSSVTVPMLIFRVADDRALYANEAMAAMVHSTVADLQAQAGVDFYRYPEDRQRVLQGLKAEERIDNIELELKRQGGEPFWALFSARLFDYKGEMAIIASVYDITERKRVEAMLTKRAAELTTVAQISTAVATILSPQEMLQTVVDLVQDRFELYHAHIYVLDSQDQELVLTAGAGEIGRRMCAEKHSIPLHKTQSLVARAARNRQGIIVNDVRKNDAFLPHPLLPDTCAEMAVPMLGGEHVLGVLDLQSNQINGFTNQDVQIQTTLAAQVSVALQNARTLEATELARAELDDLNRRLTQEGWYDYLHQNEVEMAFSYPAVTPMVTNGVGEEALVQALQIQGQAIGELILATDGMEAEDIQEIMASVAANLSDHIENLRLSEQTQRALSITAAQAQRLTKLNEMGAALGTAASVEQIYQIAVEGTAEILQVDHVWLPLLGEDGHTLEVVAVQDEAAVPALGTQLPLAGSPMEQAHDERQLIVSSGLIAPLLVSGRFIGTLNIDEDERREFDQADQTILQQIATLVAASIENRQLLSAAQLRASREQLLREITTQVRSSADIETIMRTAVSEVGRALGRQTIIQLDDESGPEEKRRGD